MANRNISNKDVYDTVFDFIFDTQKKKENKKPPRDFKNFSAPTQSLLEIGLQPTIYPLESAFSAINSAMSRAMEIDFGNGVKGGLGSGAFSNPVKYIKSEVAKNRAKANWATVGGSLNYNIDSALLSLYAKHNGVDGRLAHEIGEIFRETKEEELYSNKGLKDLLPYRTPEDVKKREREFFPRVVDIQSQSLVDRYNNLDKKFLNKLIIDLQSEQSKNERIKKTVTLLQSKGLSSNDSLNAAYSIWGDNKSSDNGMFFLGRDKWNKAIGNIKQKAKLNNMELSKLEALSSIEDPILRKRQIYSVLKNNRNLDSKAAFSFAQELASIQSNDTYSIAKRTIYEALSSELIEKLKREGKYDKIALTRKRLQNLVESRGTLGAFTERGVLLSRWLSSAKSWNGLLLNGVWQKIGVDGLEFTQIVKGKAAYDEDGKQIGQYFVPGDSVIGQILGPAYYLHPNNLINGLFIDGSLWLKWACDKNGSVNSKSFAYLMHQVSLGNSLSFIMKPLKDLSKKIVEDIVGPIFDGLKRSIKNLATKILGLTGIGGMLVSFLMNFISDKFAQIMGQMIIAFILGLAGIVFILIEGFVSLYSDNYTEALIDSNSEIYQVNSISSNDKFTDDDFILP